MADFIGDNITGWLHPRLTTECSAPITYLRGSDSVSINATWQKNVRMVSDGAGNTKIERPDATFDFDATALNFGAGQVEPDADDEIQAVFGSVTKRFRLLPIVGGEAAWRYLDPQQTRVRCNTKYIGNL